MKNEQTKIYGRLPLKNLKWYSLPRETISSAMVYLERPCHIKFFKGCLPQILLGPFLNTFFLFLAISFPLKSPSDFIFLVYSSNHPILAQYSISIPLENVKKKFFTYKNNSLNLLPYPNDNVNNLKKKIKNNKNIRNVKELFLRRH